MKSAVVLPHVILLPVASLAMLPSRDVRSSCGREVAPLNEPDLIGYHSSHAMRQGESATSSIAARAYLDIVSCASSMDHVSVVARRVFSYSSPSGACGVERNMTRAPVERCPAAVLAIFFLLTPGFANSDMPAVIDRAQFFSDPDISGPQLSPDGKSLAFLKTFKGVRNVWIKPVTEPFDKARPLTATSRPPAEYFWSTDSKYILYTQDTDGDEVFNLYTVDVAQRPRASSAVPPARELTHGTGTSATVYDLPETFPDLVYVGLNDRDRDWYDLYAIKISTGERTLMRRNDIRATDWIFDDNGQLQLARRVTDSGDQEVLRISGDTVARIYGCTVFETCDPVRYDNVTEILYLNSNQGPAADRSRLLALELHTGRQEGVDEDPEHQVDLDSALFSKATGRLIATVYRGDKGSRYVWHDARVEKDFELLRHRLPGKELSVLSPLENPVWFLIATSDIEPGEAFTFDRRSRRLTFQYRMYHGLSRRALATRSPIRYPSSDGLEIPAYLTLPRGVEPKSLPLLVMAHGGPWARDLWGYDKFAQFFANRGFAVLQPNYRGSTGYGRKFVDAGNREWGDKMQDDITAGVKHLVARGMIDPKRVVLFGASYGGYVALSGLAFTPEIYAAAAEMVGPADLASVVRSLTEFAGPYQQMFYARIGDPTTAAGRAQLERQSPLHLVNEIKAPLLVVQGANDPRVKQAQSDELVASLRRRGVEVTYLIAKDEGHVMGIGEGFAQPINNLAVIAATERFFAAQVGTRHQEGMPPEVRRKLQELLVTP
jgi:dipeptidyl aminopeptidase/acylaminoacyl peptidase